MQCDKEMEELGDSDSESAQAKDCPVAEPMETQLGEKTYSNEKVTVNEHEEIIVRDKEDEMMAEVPSTSTNSIESAEITSLLNDSPISNDNDESPSSNNSSKIKRGQTNIDSGISIEKSENSSDEDSSKRLKLNESTQEKSETGSENSPNNASKFYKLNSKVKKRNYRNKRSTPAESAGGNSDQDRETEQDTSGPTDNASTVSHDEVIDSAMPNVSEDNEGTNSECPCQEGEQRGLYQSKNHSCVLQSGRDNNKGFSDEDTSNEWTTTSEDEAEEEKKTPECLKKTKPKPNWFIIPEIINRELGKNKFLPQRFYGSLHVVERLELMYKLNEHEGCVNALNFNRRGNLLASTSDDLTVVIWDWAIGKKSHSFDSGHRSNMFQAKWLPLDPEYLMVTCARDGQVRLMDLRHGGASRRLATHHGPTHKLAVHAETPHVIISAGEDAKVLSIDIREIKPTKLLTVKEGSSDVQLYSVHLNPLNSNEFVIGGRTQTVRIYDRRKLSTPLHKLCPEHLASNRHAHVTCAVYNFNGTEVLASYNDEDIYLFDTVLQQTGDYAHRYQGHRNSATVKGVNFFGPRSEFIISGSDCGNIFIWEKNTEAIVQWMPGDEQGVVNCLEPHPHVPILATSGLDYDVKIWVPSCEHPPTMENLESCIKSNLRNREQDNANDRDAFDGQMLWILLRHIRHTERVQNLNARRRSRNRGEDAENEDGNEELDEREDSSNDDDSSTQSDSQSDEGVARVQCPTS